MGLRHRVRQGEKRPRRVAPSCFRGMYTARTALAHGYGCTL
jgi:hypothetical protein